MKYYLGVDSPSVWEEVRRRYPNIDAEPHPFGFPAHRSAQVRKIRPDDRIISYMKGTRTFFAVWRVIRQLPDCEVRYSENVFSACVEVSSVILVQPEHGIKIKDVRDKLKLFEPFKNKNWGSAVRPSAKAIDDEDGQIILDALEVIAVPEQVTDLNEINSRTNINRTTKEQLINARIGQGKFREDVLACWENRCAVTGTSVTAAIRASHLQPWKGSTDSQRLDPNNGLPLLATLDALFDRYLITFDKTGWLKLSAELSNLSSADLGRLGINDAMRLRRQLTDEQETFLALHRAAFSRRSGRPITTKQAEAGDG
jgi:HNH endonuclease